MGWKDIPNNLKWVYNFLTPARQYGYKKTKDTASVIRKGFDAGVRGLDYVSKQVVKNPLPTIPLVAGAGLGAYNFSKNRAANSARIEDPNSGVTRIRPFTGRIEFTNPM